MLERIGDPARVRILNYFDLILSCAPVPLSARSAESRSDLFNLVGAALNLSVEMKPTGPWTRLLKHKPELTYPLKCGIQVIGNPVAKVALGASAMP